MQCPLISTTCSVVRGRGRARASITRLHMHLERLTILMCLSGGRLLDPPRHTSKAKRLVAGLRLRLPVVRQSRFPLSLIRCLQRTALE